MGTINFYTKFDYTDAAGNLYSDGSTSVAHTITVVSDEIFDRTYSIGPTATLTTLLNDDLISDFDFLWIESDQQAEIQLVCNELGVHDTAASDDSDDTALANGWVVKLEAGIPFCLHNDDSRNRGDVGGNIGTNYLSEQSTWETSWNKDVIDRIEFYHETGSVAKVSVIAIT